MPFTSSAYPFVVLIGLVASAVAADEKPKLNITQVGDDLVASTTITVNAGPHVLWTHVGGVISGDVRLYYYVIQNRDKLYRSKKQIDVKWRLVGHKPGEANYHVEKSFLPSSSELKALLPQLQKLMEKEEEETKSRPKPQP